jgi:hypothetical protein
MNHSQTSQIREVALNFLEEAYQTNQSQGFCRERANYIERSVARHYGQHLMDSKTDPISAINRSCDGPLINSYINTIVDLVLHLSQKTYTGYYSERLNDVLRNNEIPYNLPQWSQVELFPELFKNPQFSEEERQNLEDLYNKERIAIREAFDLALKGERGYQPRLFPVAGEEEGHYEDLYSECCARTQAGYNTPCQTQLFVEEGPHGTQVFNLPTKQLLQSILKDEINPLTGKPYHLETLRQMNSKFRVELKLLS